MSRIIVKNIPKHSSEYDLKEHFNEFGIITDVRILKKDGKSRQICFIGFKDNLSADNAIKYMNSTFIHTSKVIVQKAESVNSITEKENRPWSKYSKGSSEHKRLNPDIYKQEEIKILFDKDLKRANIKKQDDNNKDKLEELLINELIEWKRTKLLMKKESGLNHHERTRYQSEIDQIDKEIEEKRLVEEKIREDEEFKKQDLELKKREEKDDAFNKNKSDLDYLKGFTTSGNIDSDDEDEDNSNNNNNNNTIHSDNEEEKVEEKVLEVIEEKKIEEDIETCGDHGRLFVKNIPYTCTEKELDDYFKSVGEISTVKICLDEDTQKSRGFAYITYVFPETSIIALNQLNGSCFQGRIIHLESAQVLPEKEELEKGVDGNNKSSYKKSQKDKLKNQTAAQREQSWNLLYVSANSATDAIANKLNMKKSDLLNRDSSDLAVTVALGETHIIQETKHWLEKEGIRVEAFDRYGPKLLTSSNTKCIRSKDTLILKHLPPDRVNIDELKERFTRHGQIRRFCISPSKTVCIIQYSDEEQCKRVFLKENGSRYKHVPIMLEYGPENVFIDSNSNLKDSKTKFNELQQDIIKDEQENLVHSIFIKNLSFNTDENSLKQMFQQNIGFRKCSIMKKTLTGGIQKSLGYGFIEFNTMNDCIEVVKKRQNCSLDGHILNLQISQKNKLNESKDKLIIVKDKNGKDLPPISSKICVRNLAFETNKNELKSLFSSFGTITSIRLPKKRDRSGGFRGFAFIDFLSKSEAIAAYEALQHTHFYGRKLVIEPAEKEIISVEELQLKQENDLNKINDAESKRNINRTEDQDQSFQKHKKQKTK